MKRLFQILAVTLLSATSSELCAQHNWAMVFVEKEQDIPTVVEYHSAQETAENGIVYNRIFDDSYRIRGEAYNPVKLQYGYRWTDCPMLVTELGMVTEVRPLQPLNADSPMLVTELPMLTTLNLYS